VPRAGVQLSQTCIRTSPRLDPNTVTKNLSSHLPRLGALLSEIEAHRPGKPMEQLVRPLETTLDAN